MTRLTLLCCAAVLVACSGREEAPADTAPATAVMPAPAPINLADVAGTWDAKAMNAAGDSTLTTFTVTATADTSGWSMSFPGRAQPVPLRVVSVSGDSIVTEAGPYQSVLRKGVRVRTTNVMRMQDGKLVGTTTARYDTKAADSVITVRMEGMRKP